MANRRKPVKVTYRKGLKAGSASAEQDEEFLEECFVDSGSLQIILNSKRNDSIILGRVGSGKSALLLSVLNQKKSVSIDPLDFSLNHIENSDAIKLLEKMGVSIDPLFQALWKHVLAVECIRAMNENNDLKRMSLEKWFRSSNLKQAEKDAIEYFDEFGGSEFWASTQVRVREIINRIENSLKTELGSEASTILAKIGSQESKIAEVKEEYVSRCESAVNNIQIQKLHKITSALAEIASGKGETIYIVIDDLDTEWTSSNIRYRLIRALIETLKKFRKVRGVKILIALRLDLLEKVIENTISSGFQDEKYEDFFFRINWTKQDLIEILDRRIRKMFMDQYTQTNVGLYDIFPQKIGSQKTEDYLIDRIAGRPRDAILFLNYILHEAEGKTQITKRVIQNAENDYSLSRMRSLLTEWADVYPNLAKTLDILKKGDSRFLIHEMPVRTLSDFVFNHADVDGDDEVTRSCIEFIEKNSTLDLIDQYLEPLQTVFGCLMKVGAIGAKFESTGRPEWASEMRSRFVAKRFELNTQIYVHPMLYRALGVRPVGSK